MPKPSSPHRKPLGVHAPTTAQHYLEPVDDGLPVRKSGNWARVKLDYLERYMDVLVTSMRDKPFRALHYIDLFAGPGKCRLEKSGAFFPGSPLLELQARYPFSRYYLVDLKPSSVHALEQRCAASALAGRVSTRVGDGNALDTSTSTARMSR